MSSKILAIEDDEFDIQFLRMALDNQREDYELEVLRDGEEALRFIDEHRTGIRVPEPCVILLDISLPKHDGLEILKALKWAPALAHIRVVVLSSVGNAEKRVEVEKWGATYRIKPMTLREIFDLGADILAICKGAIRM